MSADTLQLNNATLNADELYREETYTDLKVGSLHRLIPVTKDGQPDSTRSERFTARTQVLTPAGPLPVQAELDATTIDEALQAFPSAIQAAVRDMINEAQRAQQQQGQQPPSPGGDSGPVILK